MELLEKMLQRDRDEFKRICNKLLSRCFLCKANESGESRLLFCAEVPERISGISVGSWKHAI